MKSEIINIIKKIPTWDEAKTDSNGDSFKLIIWCFVAYWLAWLICFPFMIIIDIFNFFRWLKDMVIKK